MLPDINPFLLILTKYYFYHHPNYYQHSMKKAILGAALLASLSVAAQQPKIYIAFQWHMHQPIYTPGETVMETHQGGSLSYDLLDVFTSRTGATPTGPHRLSTN